MLKYLFEIDVLIKNINYYVFIYYWSCQVCANSNLKYFSCCRINYVLLYWRPRKLNHKFCSIRYLTIAMYYGAISWTVIRVVKYWYFKASSSNLFVRDLSSNDTSVWTDKWYFALIFCKTLIRGGPPCPCVVNKVCMWSRD